MEVTVAQGTLAGTMQDLLEFYCGTLGFGHAQLDVEDLDLPQTVTHAFYFRYLLPIWFDIQVIEFKPGFEPEHRWTYS
jgi:hypothetical protein